MMLQVFLLKKIIIEFFKKDAHIDDLLISKKISFGEKNYIYFIAYMDYNYKTKPLHIMPPETNTYVKSYEC